MLVANTPHPVQVKQVNQCAKVVLVVNIPHPVQDKQVNQCAKVVLAVNTPRQVQDKLLKLYVKVVLVASGPTKRDSHLTMTAIAVPRENIPHQGKGKQASRFAIICALQEGTPHRVG